MTQDIRSVKGKTPENFIKQLNISGAKSTLQSKNFAANKDIKVSAKRRGGGSLK